MINLFLSVIFGLIGGNIASRVGIGTNEIEFWVVLFFGVFIISLITKDQIE